MAKFNLEKGQSFSIEKTINKIHAGLGWDAPDSGGVPYDLDVHCFGLLRGQAFNDGSHFLCYAFVKSSTATEGPLMKKPDGSFLTMDGSMSHTADNRTGAGAGDDETFDIDLAKLPTEIDELAVWVTIDKAAQRKHDFGHVKSAYIHIDDGDTDAIQARYDLSNEFAGMSSVQVGSFMKVNGTWSFTAVGAGSTNDLGAILAAYGLS